MVTNGIIINKRMADRLIKAGMTHFHFSLHTLDQEMADRLANAKYPVKKVMDVCRHIASGKAKLLLVPVLLAGINDYGWFTAEMYNTWHTPCGQCYAYYLTVYYKGQEKTVKAVDGGTDAPADYWQVVSIINGVIPHFEPAP